MFDVVAATEATASIRFSTFGALLSDRWLATDVVWVQEPFRIPFEAPGGMLDLCFVRIVVHDGGDDDVQLGRYCISTRMLQPGASTLDLATEGKQLMETRSGTKATDRYPYTTSWASNSSSPRSLSDRASPRLASDRRVVTPKGSRGRQCARACTVGSTCLSKAWRTTAKSTYIARPGLVSQRADFGAICPDATQTQRKLSLRPR